MAGSQGFGRDTQGQSSLSQSHCIVLSHELWSRFSSRTSLGWSALTLSSRLFTCPWCWEATSNIMLLNTLFHRGGLSTDEHWLLGLLKALHMVLYFFYDPCLLKVPSSNKHTFFPVGSTSIFISLPLFLLPDLSFLAVLGSLSLPIACVSFSCFLLRIQSHPCLFPFLLPCLFFFL